MAAAISAWVFAGGAAQAGGAGADLGGAQDALNSVCGMFGVTSCPTLPTINQLVIENSAIGGQSPDAVRNLQHIAPGGAIDAGTAFAGNPVFSSNQLGFLSPPNKTGLPIPTTNPSANAFLSAATSPDPNTGGTPTTLNLSFDFKSRTQSAFGLNQDVGDITLPFAVTDGGGNLLRQPLLTVQLRGTGGTAVDAQVLDSTGGLEGTAGQTFALSDLGMSFSVDFSGGSEVLDLGIPLIGFDNLLSFPATGFGLNGLFEGIDPIASFLDASFADDLGALVHGFHADLAIAFDGTTLLSDPLPTPEPPALVLVAGALLALALVRRRSLG